jgi:hypothetical protein
MRVLHQNLAYTSLLKEQMGKSGSAIVCSKTGLLDIDVRLGRLVTDGEILLKKRPYLLPDNLFGSKGIDAFSIEFRLALFGLTYEVISAIFKDDFGT